MAKPQIHGLNRVVPASAMLQAIADSLNAIKTEDGLTWADIGAAIGKSDDQAAKYGDAAATMDALTFARACQHWNGRFANGLFGLIGMHVAANNTSESCERAGMIAMTRLLVELQTAMLDGEIGEDDWRALRPWVESAGQLVDDLRTRLSLKAVAA